MISVRHVPSGTSSFYGFDPLSNTRLLTSPAGVATDRYRYKAFGEEVSSSGSTTNPHRFGGRVGYYRDKIERVYVRARHYAPTNGRWLSRDPMGFYAGDFNLYRYVRNDPVDQVDPTGWAPWDDWFNTRPATGTFCQGRCGAQIDHWISNEIKSQLDGVTAWKRKGGIKYVHWANGNQRYKDADFFKFNTGTTNPPCGTRRCGFSVTVCGICVKSAILGNIMYGLVGGYLNIPLWRLIQAASGTKQDWAPGRPPFTKYDEEAYKVGRKLWNRLAPQGRLDHYVSSQEFCQAFKPLVAQFPKVLRTVVQGEGGRRHGDYEDLTHCEPCPHVTRENRHGGNSNWEPWWP